MREENKHTPLAKYNIFFLLQSMLISTVSHLCTGTGVQRSSMNKQRRVGDLCGLRYKAFLHIADPMAGTAREQQFTPALTSQTTGHITE